MANELGAVAPEETPQTEPPSGEAPSQELDIEKVDNVAQLREHAKSLKEDLNKYKPAYEFINEKGGQTALEQASQIYSGFTSDEFDPDQFSKVLSELSPDRAKRLTESISTEQAQRLYEEQLKKTFGGIPDENEVKLFNEWKTNGFLGDDNDIPENLKYDDDGNPKSEAELEFLRNIHKQSKQLKQEREAIEAEKQRQAQQARQEHINNQINEFNNSSLNVLKSELGNFIKYDESDTPEVRQQKQFLEQFFINGISGIMMSDPEMSRPYFTALKHIEKGENLLAQRYSANVEEALLKLTRNDAVIKLLESLATQSTPPQEPRKEFSNSSDSSPQQSEGFDAKAKIQQLINEGKIKI